MPNKRATNQRLVSVWLNEQQLAELDAAAAAAGLTRSQYVRRALATPHPDRKGTAA